MKLEIKISEIIKKHGLGTEILDIENIQALWSNQGKLLRVRSNKQNFIVKLVIPSRYASHPKGLNTNISYQRKITSYDIEISFYSSYHYHQNLAETPKCLGYEKDNEIKYLLLEDLTDKGFKSKETISFTDVQNCIKWLAGFHSTYLNKELENLWEVGTYWHLDTRKEEFERMPNGPLKKYASLIDRKLKQSPVKTLLHGDAKQANFLFGKNKVSAVDFQYCGKGVGVQDLAYFLSSVYGESELFKVEEECLNVYFQELKKYGVSSEVELSWRNLYAYAWFDFYRFLSGWSPNHYKINTYIKYQMEKVLDEIRDR